MRPPTSSPDPQTCIGLNDQTGVQPCPPMDYITPALSRENFTATHYRAALDSRTLLVIPSEASANWRKISISLTIGVLSENAVDASWPKVTLINSRMILLSSPPWIEQETNRTADGVGGKRTENQRPSRNAVVRKVATLRGSIIRSVHGPKK